LPASQLVFDQLDDAAAVGLVLQRRVGPRALLADRPAVLAVESLDPPAIGDRQVEATVGGDLHARRAARFERADRVVEPHIDALHERAGELDVVVLEEEDLARELRSARVLDHAAQDLLTFAIARVRLACEEKTHGATLVRDERGETVEVAEDQVRTLVGREAAREADQERVGIESREHLLHQRRAVVALQERTLDVDARVREQTLAQRRARSPKSRGI
jgi:hypothetical protein